MICKKFRKDNYIRYYAKPREDQRSSLAKQLEFYAGLIILWLVSAFYIMYVWGSSLPVLIVTFLLLVVEYKLINLLRINKLKKQANHHKVWLAGMKCLKDIDEIPNHDEFKKLVKEIFTNTTAFSKVKVNKLKDKTHGIDLIAYYNNVPIAIRCEQVANPDNKLPVQYLHEMVDDLEKLGYRNGVFVTNGLFGSKTKAIAEKFKKDYAITLLDRYQLVEYARKAKHKIFPAAHVIEQLSIANQEQKNVDRIPMKNRLISERHKAIRYFTAAVILGIMYNLIEGFTFLGAIYILFAIINLILGIVTAFYGKSKYDLETININKKPG